MGGISVVPTCARVLHRSMTSGVRRCGIAPAANRWVPGALDLRHRIHPGDHEPEREVLR